MQRPQTKRRIKLIKPRLQMRLIGTFLGLAVLALLAQALVLGGLMLSLSGKLPSGGGHLADALPQTLTTAFLLSMALVVPSILVIGVHITFRIAGPLFRFERHLWQVAEGQDPGPCRLRKNDDLQEFCTLLNAAIDRARADGVHADDDSEANVEDVTPERLAG